ncbi:MAG: hypothetical protein ACJA0Q_001949 [Saprospiraceae bacterium]
MFKTGRNSYKTALVYAQGSVALSHIISKVLVFKTKKKKRGSYAILLSEKSTMMKQIQKHPFNVFYPKKYFSSCSFVNSNSPTIAIDR